MDFGVHLPVISMQFLFVQGSGNFADVCASSMTSIVIETKICAPIELCFDLARDVNAHSESAAFSSERVVARITALDRPRHFVDEMVQGSFKWLRHYHEFEFSEGITIMRDKLEWEPPLGIVGRLADRLFLRRHMHWFVLTKQNGLKRMAEAQDIALLSK